jgi:hypothetical protein
MDNKFVLKEWYIVGVAEPYLAPEACKPSLAGNVYNHPNFSDGSHITTSVIKTIDGRTITTITGSVYILDGKPSDDYLQWCDKNGFIYDSNNPIK